MILLLDTSVLIDVLNNRRGRADFLRSLTVQAHTLACCSVVTTEIFLGVPESRWQEAEHALSRLLFLPVTREAARLAGTYRYRYDRQGIALSVMDTTIAAVAVTNEVTLLTDNTKDFPIPELKLYPLPQD